MCIIEVNNISKSYGCVKALEDITFSIRKGEIFGLIGADGAGKTTMFRILTTLILPDKGSAKVEGRDIILDYKKIRDSVGYMPGRFSLYGDLTVKENLNLFASIFGKKLQDNINLINDIYVQIKPFDNRKASNLSGGMKQKLALCCALIHSPNILFLDEPTTGVDPVSRREFWDILQNLKNKGITIIVSTPYMDEAKKCNRIAFIKDGKLLEINTPEGIISKYNDALYSIKATNMHSLLDILKKYNGITSCFAFGETHHFTAIQNFDFNNLITHLELKNYKEIKIETIIPTLEDCYIKLATE